MYELSTAFAASMITNIKRWKFSEGSIAITVKFNKFYSSREKASTVSQNETLDCVVQFLSRQKIFSNWWTRLWALHKLNNFRITFISHIESNVFHLSKHFMKQLNTRFQFSVSIFLLIKNLSTFFFSLCPLSSSLTLCQKPSHFHFTRLSLFSRVIKAIVTRLKGPEFALSLTYQRKKKSNIERQQKSKYIW